MGVASGRLAEQKCAKRYAAATDAFKRLELRSNRSQWIAHRQVVIGRRRQLSLEQCRQASGHGSSSAQGWF